MEIIDSKEKYNELLRHLECYKKKTIARFSFAGESMHVGHLTLINKIKKESDLLIADYNGHCNDLYDTLNNNISYQKIKDKTIKKIELLNNIKNIENIDYLVISDNMFLEKNKNIIENIKNNFITYYKKSLELNISLEILFLVCTVLLDNPLEKITHQFGGIKNLALRPVVKYIFPEIFSKRDSEIKRSIVGGYIKNKDNHVISRTRYNKDLNILRNELFNELLKGYSKNEYFTNMLKCYDKTLNTGKFTILDFHTGKRLNEISDNCSIFLMYKNSFESILILNGNIIF